MPVLGFSAPEASGADSTAITASSVTRFLFFFCSIARCFISLYRGGVAGRDRARIRARSRPVDGSTHKTGLQAGAPIDAALEEAECEADVDGQGCADSKPNSYHCTNNKYSCCNWTSERVLEFVNAFDERHC